MTNHRMTEKSRNLPRTSMCHTLILFPSVKNKRHFYVESNLERSHLINLEFDLTVRKYAAQPASYSYINLSEKRSRYTPDCFVTYHSKKTVFQEVKPYSKTVSKTFQKKINHLSDVLLEIDNAPLEVITCRDIKPNKLNLNRDMLYQYLPLAEKEQLSTLALPFIGSQSTFTMEKFEYWARKYLGSRELAWTYLAQNLERFPKAQTVRLTRQTNLELK